MVPLVIVGMFWSLYIVAAAPGNYKPSGRIAKEFLDSASI
jgi:hypothetical protein